MNKLIIFCLFSIFSMTAWAEVGIELYFQESNIKQGSITQAKLWMNAEAVKKVSVQRLKGLTLSDELFFLDISPLIRIQDQDKFQADVKVIFAKVPQTNVLVTDALGEKLQVKWNKVQVEPTELKGSFIFEDFLIPKSLNFSLLAFVTLSFSVGIFLALQFRRKYKIKKAAKDWQRSLKATLLSAQNYEEVVSIWMDRKRYLETFPHIQSSLSSLEKVLFKYQFKPHQDPHEKEEVMQAYRIFKQEIEGKLSGI